MTVEQAIKNMWHIADKPERMRCLKTIASKIGFSDPVLFWEHFWSVWASSENLNEDSEFIDYLIDYGKALGDPALGLDDDEHETLDTLSYPVVAYRGGCEHNRDGWSWTLDRKVAHMFAMRAHGPKERFIFKTEIERDQILAYLSGRAESEIVVDHKNLVIDFDEEFEKENDSFSEIYYAIHSGKETTDGSFRAEAMMMSITPDKYTEVLDYANEVLEFSHWANLTSQVSYCESLIKMIMEKEIEYE